MNPAIGFVVMKYLNSVVLYLVIIISPLVINSFDIFICWCPRKGEQFLTVEFFCTWIHSGWNKKNMKTTFTAHDSYRTVSITVGFEEIECCCHDWFDKQSVDPSFQCPKWHLSPYARARATHTRTPHTRTYARTQAACTHTKIPVWSDYNIVLISLIDPG